MEPMTTGEIAAAVKGEVLSGTEGTRIGSVSTDTRSLRTGDLFLALKGARFDAHAFIPKAVSAGAAAVIASDSDPSCLPEEARMRTTWIRVPDTLRALQDLAAFHRRRFAIPVIGITGSVERPAPRS